MTNLKAMIALLGLFIPSAASGSLLFSSGIFVQEYWQDGKLFYAVGNHNDTDITISLLDQDGGKLAGPWKIAARSTGIFTLDTPREKEWIRFVLKDGSVLGSLHAPRSPNFGTPMTGIIRTVQGLNGSGGRREDVCVEQSATAYKPGGVVEITVILPNDDSVITFARKEPPHHFPWPRRIDRLVIIDAKSRTLRILSNDEKIEIDVSRAFQKQPEHRLTLRLRAPKVEWPQLLVFSGWREIVPGGGGHTITRGVLVDPNLK